MEPQCFLWVQQKLENLSLFAVKAFDDSKNNVIMQTFLQIAKHTFLQKTQLRRLFHFFPDCEIAYGFEISDTMMCAGAQGLDTCQGDSVSII